MDFYNIMTVQKRDGTLQVRPDWKVGRSKDLMTRSGSFYAIWDEEKGLWSTDIYDVQRLVDQDLMRYADEQEKITGVPFKVARMQSHKSGLWDEFARYIRNSGPNSHNLNEKLVFENTEVKKEDYASLRLGYPLVEGPCPAWDSIVGTLYSVEERAKIEWAIGAVVSGDSKSIQKFLVFYGPPGSGKSTILNIIQRLFAGYVSTFDARELAGNNNSFATSAFKSNPLVAIQHDGDLSRIYDNTKLNSIVAHEVLPINEKYKATWEQRSNAFLFMGTNLPVKITDAKSGIIRRLIDVVPTGQTLEHDLYHELMDRIEFEMGAIAYYCLQRYSAMGKNFYSNYRPVEMMLQTDVFFNYVEAHYDIFKAQDGATLNQAWSLYVDYCNDTGIDAAKRLAKYKLREELKNYFEVFQDRARVDGKPVRSYYSGFKFLEPPKPKAELPSKPEGLYEIVLEPIKSVFDEVYFGQPAQIANDEGLPPHMWKNVTSYLGDIDTSELHYVQVPESHIVIDFDLTDENGNKDLQRNLHEASKWPATYTEVSKSGSGIHLHYIYGGDVHSLDSVYAEGIEVKTLLGGQSLRRKLTLCNSVNITPIDGGLPKKEKKTMMSASSVKSEKGLRELIERNLKKDIHPGTKPSVDFIHKILEDAYSSGLAYDVTDLRARIVTFAAMSTNHASDCTKKVLTMKFASEEAPSGVPDDTPLEDHIDDRLVFFDVEVYKNLFVVCWKYHGSDQVVKMVNPTQSEIEHLLKQKLVGFNNRRYDNHILYARYLGYSLLELYDLSQKIINGGNNRDMLFAQAYNLSYADIYDFSSKKQGLKKFQIELGIHHSEIDIPWDEYVDKSLWDKVVTYCVNDVVSTEAVFDARKADFTARRILAQLSGLTVNDTTQRHTAQIIFKGNRNAKNSFVYTHLAEMFEGYQFEGNQSTYRGIITGEGGYVYAEPGMYENVALLDVASMHPTSIIELNLFGPYTERFKDLLDARLAIKKKDYDAASKMLDGQLDPFLRDATDEYDIQAANELSFALKIVINIVYGLTSAKFDNAFNDIRNKDNIVAKRGALFMIDLQKAVQEKGFTVAHIKTDSIKIPNATPEIIEFVTEFGKQYGYDFEHEGTYDKFCLVNDAVYIAKEGDKWAAVGAQFQHPYVFKTLFSGEELTFDDICETKNVAKGVMYLDFDGNGEVVDMLHVGRTGSFVPVVDRGGDLWRVADEKLYAVTGTKGRKWVTREQAVERDLDYLTHHVDNDYFDTLVDKAREAIQEHNPHPFEWFVA